LRQNFRQQLIVLVNVGATFPDDFEDSPLKSEILEKRNRNEGVEPSYHPVRTSSDISHNATPLNINDQNIYEIYESIQGKPPSPPKSAKKAKPTQKKQPDPAGEERAPELDEL
jgi:hypothetical protein